MLATRQIGGEGPRGARSRGVCAVLLAGALSCSLPASAADAAAGWEAYRRGDYETALREWRSAAERGDAEAQSQLGSLYEAGEGVAQDLDTALRWYRLAAEQGHLRAQLVLIPLLERRDDPSGESLAEAARWLHATSDAGSVTSQHKLGLWYLRGYGVPEDPLQAERWMRRAAEQGFAPAQYELGRIYWNGNGVEYDPAEAKRWLEKACASGVLAAREILHGRSRLRDYHLENGRFLAWPHGRPVVVRTPEEIRRGPRSPAPLAGLDEVHCEFFPRENQGGNPKFRCFQRTGPPEDGGRYYDFRGNVRGDATEVLLRVEPDGVRPVLAENGTPLTDRMAFRSRLVPPLELKIKYAPREGADPVRDRDMHSEVAAARLLWAMRYAVDRMYFVPRVVCHRCPPDPFSSLEPAAEGERQVFENVAVELRFGGEDVVSSEEAFGGGWSWGDELWRLRYGRGVEGFSDEQKARFDGLLVLMTLIGQESGRPDQNRLACVRESNQPLALWRFCPETVFLTHDLGAVFGKRRADSLAAWTAAPVWRDAATCELALTLEERRLEVPRPVHLGRDGQRFILSLLEQLTAEHLRAVFESAVFERYDATLLAPGEAPGPERSREIVDAWVEGFRRKVEELREVECAVR